VADLVIKSKLALSGLAVASISGAQLSIVALLCLVDASDSWVAAIFGASVIVITGLWDVEATLLRMADILSALVVVIAADLSGHARSNGLRASCNLVVQAILVLSTLDLCSLDAVVSLVVFNASLVCSRVAWSVRLSAALSLALCDTNWLAGVNVSLYALFLLKSAFLFRAEELCTSLASEEGLDGLSVGVDHLDEALVSGGSNACAFVIFIYNGTARSLSLGIADLSELVDSESSFASCLLVVDAAIITFITVVSSIRAVKCVAFSGSSASCLAICNKGSEAFSFSAFAADLCLSFAVALGISDANGLSIISLEEGGFVGMRFFVGNDSRLVSWFFWKSLASSDKSSEASAGSWGVIVTTVLDCSHSAVKVLIFNVFWLWCLHHCGKSSTNDN